MKRENAGVLMDIMDLDVKNYVLIIVLEKEYALMGSVHVEKDMKVQTAQYYLVQKQLTVLAINFA